MCVKVCQSVLNSGIEEFIRTSKALGWALPLMKGKMYVNVCKSVSECVQQLY